MKVSINYSVDADDIPNEVQKLYREAFQKLVIVEDKETDLDEAFHWKSYNKAHDILEEMRAGLIDLDVRFSDCQNILLDYQQMLVVAKLKELSALHTQDASKQLSLDLDNPVEEDNKEDNKEEDDENEKG